MARVEPAPPAELRTESAHVVHSRAARLDLHKTRITAAGHLPQPQGDPVTATHLINCLQNLPVTI